MVVGVEKEFVGNGDCGGWLMIFDKVLNDMELDIRCREGGKYDS